MRQGIGASRCLPVLLYTLMRSRLHLQQQNTCGKDTNRHDHAVPLLLL